MPSTSIGRAGMGHDGGGEGERERRAGVGLGDGTLQFYILVGQCVVQMVSKIGMVMICGYTEWGYRK